MKKKLSSKEISLLFLTLALVAIKTLGVYFATEIFSKYSPLIDSNLYLSNFYKNESTIRTVVVQKLAILISGFGGNFFAHFVFGLISTAGFIYYYLRGGRSWAILLFLLLPSSLVWTSIVGKDALFFGGFGLILFIWSKFSIDSLDIFDLFSLILGFSICLIMRPHYAFVLIWLFFSTALLKVFAERAFSSLIIAFILCGLSIYFFAWEQLLARGYGAIDSLARASRFEFFGIIPHSEIGFERFRELISLGIITGIIGPMPSELISRPVFIPFFLEGLLILIFPFVLMWVLSGNLLANRTTFIRIFWWSLVPGIFLAMVIHAPFGLLNPGSAIRWRTDFEQIFYLAPFLLFLQMRDD